MCIFFVAFPHLTVTLKINIMRFQVAVIVRIPNFDVTTKKVHHQEVNVFDKD